MQIIVLSDWIKIRYLIYTRFFCIFLVEGIYQINHLESPNHEEHIKWTHIRIYQIKHLKLTSFWLAIGANLTYQLKNSVNYKNWHTLSEGGDAQIFKHKHTGWGTQTTFVDNHTWLGHPMDKYKHMQFQNIQTICIRY